MAGKGDRNRTADLVSYENNWDTIFGKKDTNTPAVEAMTNNEFFERISMNSINRLEVIDKTGRAYTHYFSGNEKVRYSLQDDNRTLKIFIDEFGSTVIDNAE